MSSCRFRELLVGYLRDELEAGDEQAVKRHLKECRDCRAELKKISKLYRDTRSITVPYPSSGEWDEMVDNAARKPVSRWQPGLAAASLAAVAAIAAIVIINKFTPPTETPVAVAAAESSEMQRSGGPSAVAPAELRRDKLRQEDAAVVKSGEGEQPSEGIVAKDSRRPRRGGPLRPPGAEGGPGMTKAAADVAAGADESPLRFQAAADARRGDPSAVAKGLPLRGQPRRAMADKLRSPARPSGAAETAAQPASRIPEEPAFTPAPFTQKDKVAIKHNRIDPSLGESMTVSVKVDGQEPTSVKIYSRIGKLVRVLVDKELAPGIHSFEWSGRDDRGTVLASGIYFIVIEAPGFKLREKAVILK